MGFNNNFSQGSVPASRESPWLHTQRAGGPMGFNNNFSHGSVPASRESPWLHTQHAGGPTGMTLINFPRDLCQPQVRTELIWRELV